MGWSHGASCWSSAASKKAVLHRIVTGRLHPVHAVLDRRTFTLTESQLERRFLPIARMAGLPPPQTSVS